MANTFTQIHIQVVMSVKNRNSVISKEWKDELFKYMTGIIQNQGHKVLSINGMPDHVHILIGLRPTQSLSELMKYVKNFSAIWINQKGFLKDKFSWQGGFGAFSYSKSHVQRVVEYINRQEEHHKKRTFTDEYLDLLKKFRIEFDERYIFQPIDLSDIIQ